MLMVMGPIGIGIFMSDSTAQFTLIRLINFQMVPTTQKGKVWDTSLCNVIPLAWCVIDPLSTFLHNNQCPLPVVIDYLFPCQKADHFPLEERTSFHTLWFFFFLGSICHFARKTTGSLFSFMLLFPTSSLSLIVAIRESGMWKLCPALKGRAIRETTVLLLNMIQMTQPFSHVQFL